MPEAKTIKLSFCIPTLNFGPFIGQTLTSILDQVRAGVQIVIVDGGSTDGTQDIVAEMSVRYPHIIKFVQRERRYGIDLDILESVQQADGEYCWLFSSDDLVAPGALAKALAATDRGDWDVLLLGMTCCTLDMKPLYDHPILDCREARTFDWSVAKERADYFRRAHTTTGFCSFISDVVVRRERWLLAPPVDRHVGSCWIIAAKMFAMAQQGLRVRFDPSIYVLKRGDNDSFISLGLVRRVALAIRGFRSLAVDFFGKGSMEAKHVSRVITDEYPFRVMLDWKRRIVSSGDAEEDREFYRLAELHYAGSGALGALQYFFVRWIPAGVLSIVRPIALRIVQVLRR